MWRREERAGKLITSFRWDWQSSSIQRDVVGYSRGYQNYQLTRAQPKKHLPKRITVHASFVTETRTAAMVGYSRSWTVPRWILVSIFLICWIHLTAGKCQHYGHACLGAHGKKRAEGRVTMDSVPQSPRHPKPIPHYLSPLVNGDSSEEMTETLAIQPIDHLAMDTPRLIGTRLHPRFALAILTSRRNRG